jgi:hypothetical protein
MSVYHGFHVRRADSPKGATQERAARKEEESNRNDTYNEGILGLKSDMA